MSLMYRLGWRGGTGSTCLGCSDSEGQEHLLDISANHLLRSRGSDNDLSIFMSVSIASYSLRRAPEYSNEVSAYHGGVVLLSLSHNGRSHLFMLPAILDCAWL